MIRELLQDKNTKSLTVSTEKITIKDIYGNKTNKAIDELTQPDIDILYSGHDSDTPSLKTVFIGSCLVEVIHLIFLVPDRKSVWNISKISDRTACEPGNIIQFT